MCVLNYAVIITSLSLSYSTSEDVNYLFQRGFHVRSQRPFRIALTRVISTFLGYLLITVCV